jgi:tetraacyldisaccharide 4'-kinase
MLREPLSSIKRASAAIITRCDQQSKNQLEKIENKLKNINPNIKTAKSVHAPVCVKSAKDEQIALQDLQGRKIAAFCGIGNPNAFFNTLKSLNADLVATSVFDDHHPYTESDIADIFRLSQEAGARMVITTQKDFTRIPQSCMENNDLTLAYLVIELKISEGKEIITQLIENVIESKIS